MDLFKDPTTLLMLAVLAVLIFFMFRNSRKRKAQAAELRTTIVPGAEIMTNFGLYGTLISIDEVSKVAEVEVAPGNIVRVHSQTIAKVVTPGDIAEGEPRSVEEAMERANREAEAKEAAAAEPEFGERIEETPEATTPAVTPAKKSTKKADD